jgi:hypothetical protein
VCDRIDANRSEHEALSEKGAAKKARREHQKQSEPDDAITKEYGTE